MQREHAELLAPSLAKLRQLLLALNAEFGRIRELHCAGELRMLAPQELLSLLNALFDCTALRGKQVGREFVALLERCCLCAPPQLVVCGAATASSRLWGGQGQSLLGECRAKVP